MASCGPPANRARRRYAAAFGLAMAGPMILACAQPAGAEPRGSSCCPSAAARAVGDDPTQPYCERDDASPRGSHLVLGDAALSGLFEEYGRLGGKAEVSDALTRLESR